ncbi:MAG: hypothetical protein KJ709_03635 [Nanoarchaeota archaeon]|nr:hypothetical protein [Nanoarchaeota archaeon]
MFNLAELEQYFPEPNKPILDGRYIFTITIQQDKDSFALNLKIKQHDTGEEHLIKFRFGISKHKETLSASHDTEQPHFEIDIYKREKDAFSARVYFTFQNPTDEQLLDYAKGTVVIMNKIIKHFIQNQGLDEAIIGRLVYDKAVIGELSIFEPKLIEALCECYKHSHLVVRQDGKTIIIKTPHNLRKYLGVTDLEPLYLLLLEKIEK